MRIIFMGTPDFSVGIMEAMAERGHEIVLAVTQPDKPKGRGGKVSCSPVKEAALRRSIPVFQPKKIRDPENIATLREHRPDMIVVAAFGQILPEEILSMAPYGCINVHASLLPKYRGASPIQWAVLDGEKESGVTIMRMDAGVDTGDIVAQKAIPLDAEETAGSLFDKLSVLGASLLCDTIELIESGAAVYTPQNHAKATHTGKIEKSMGKMDWTLPAETLERRIRGLSPWPGAYTMVNNKTLKIWKATVCQNASGAQKAAPGSVLDTKEALVVQTGDGALALTEVQLEGKKRMDAAAFLRGYPLPQGTVL
ncbi:MAG: methionyl-tRNA formyltransferase [Lachnospiraceae bacterium]|nr:methionyl-tRNA formyltransferase [Lachnospiraceae bacterium]